MLAGWLTDGRGPLYSGCGVGVGVSLASLALLSASSSDSSTEAPSICICRRPERLEEKLMGPPRLWEGAGFKDLGHECTARTLKSIYST